MPRCAVLDSTILVSGFLTPGGTADALVDHAKAGRLTGAVAEAIFAETARVLLATRIRYAIRTLTPTCRTIFKAYGKRRWSSPTSLRSQELCATPTMT